MRTSLLLVSLLVPLGCYSSPGNNGGAGGDATTGAGGDTGSGGTTGAGGGAGGGSGGSGAGGSGAGGTAAGNGGTTGQGGSGAGGAGAGGAGAGGTGGKLMGTARITMLGDSTTSDGCFRAYLWQSLTMAGRSFDFVGTRTGNPGCTVAGFNQRHEGHGGYIVTDILKTTSTGRPGGADSSDPFVSSAQDLMTWFDGHPTDVVLMNFGTNDVSNNISAAMITSAFSAILARLRANNPNVRMMVAQIPPIAWIYCTATVCGPRVMALNTAIVTWAQQNNTAASPVTVVDLFTGYDDATDTTDGVHANDSGSRKIGAKWFAAVNAMF